MSERPTPTTPAELEELYARLIDRGLTLDRIARLTDRQIADLYFHPRDDDGAVKRRPEPAAAPELPAHEQDRRAILTLMAAGVPAGELIEGWRKKYPGQAWEG